MNVNSLQKKSFDKKKRITLSLFLSNYVILEMIDYRTPGAKKSMS